MLSKFYKIQSSDTKVNLLQDAVDKALTPVLNVPLIDGVLLKNVSIATGLNIVNHTLGREPLGWIVVDKNSSATVYRQTSAIPDRTLNFVASGSGVFSFWVF